MERLPCPGRTARLRWAGRVSVRRALTPTLARVGGHIGFSVRPAYRRRGYGTTLLRAGLGIARDLGVGRTLVTCATDNVGSAAVIERCGDLLEDVVDIPGLAPARRYRVPTT
ncbi:GNAT family N-acetyltransferase [Luteimicrobium sp. DT211]|uniref:GNAT family N-acetyltransferase n=1 Tax=Luteimicrobium sp. DT211 TaxID=3393412 RepID=UPI003CF3C472